ARVLKAAVRQNRTAEYPPTLATLGSPAAPAPDQRSRPAPHAYAPGDISRAEGGRARVSDAGEAGRGHLRQDSEGGARGPPLDAQGALDRQPELDVERVAPVARDDVREDRAAEERQVADEVEDLVADEPVAVAQAVERAAVREA